MSDLGLDISTLDIRKQMLELEKYELEQSLYAFLQAAWPHFDPAAFDGNWHIEAIAEHLEAVVDGGITRLIINVPPRSCKTSLCSLVLPAWVWAQREIGPNSGPQVKFLYASYGESLSLDHSVMCRRLVKSEWYQERWGDRFALLADADMKSRFDNDKGGNRQITSIGGRVTGKGADVIVIDDPNATNDISDRKLIEVTDWFDNTIRSRLNDKKTGAIALIQQRTAEKDLTGHILEKYTEDGFNHLMIPLEFEPDRSFPTSIGWTDPRENLGDPLWPERFDEKFVRAEKKAKYVWAGQYQQRPEVAGGGIIKRDWWQTWEDKSFPPMDFILASLDTAYTAKTSNDPSAMTVWGVFTTDDRASGGRSIDADGRPIYFDRAYNETAPKVMLMHAWSEHLEFFDLIKKVEKTCKLLKVDRLLVENKASGISVAQELRRLYGSAEFAVQLSDPKSLDKMARLFSVQHIFEEGVIYAPDKTWADMVITQVGQFPKGKHDDLCFVAGTQIATARGSVPIEQMRIGDRVVTPLGFRRVIAAGPTGEHSVTTRGKLTGTGNHPVFVVDTGWVELDTTTEASPLLELNICDLIRATHPRQLSLMVPFFEEWAESESTTYRSPGTTQGAEAPKGYTWLYGSTTTARRFRQSTMCITSTAIRSIAALKILSAYRCASIAAYLRTWIWKLFARTSTECGLWPLLGTNPKRAEHGTAKLPRKVLPRLARFFVTPRPRQVPPAFGAGHLCCLKQADGSSALTFAAESTPSSNWATEKLHTPILQPVYNLTVEGAHCYYANGILVHNCDTVSQSVRHLRDMGLLTRSAERLEALDNMVTYPGGADAPLYPS